MASSRRARTPQVKSEPKLPFPKQYQKAPGLEARLSPQPRYKALKYKAAGKLKGKVALITGGDSGIGRAVAVLYAREGAHVAIAYLPEEESDAQTTRRAVVAHGRKCLLLPGDLTSTSMCDAAVDKTVRELGKLDILVSNAAHQARKEALEEVTDDEFELTFQTNIYAYFRVARAALRYMKAGSAIIATSSETAIFGSKRLPDYSATKARSTPLPRPSQQI
jgi:NAD(P)-dependent dehydrogenase (short-subunit alcohol dehydrogenase family)